MITKDPLRNFQVLNTDNADLARSILMDKYGADTMECSSADTFGVNASFLKLNGISLSYCNYTSAVDIRFPEAEFVRQHIFLGGRGRVSLERSSCEVSSDRWSAVVPSGTSVQYSYGRNSRQLVIWFDSNYLRSKINALFGTSKANQIEFSPPRASASSELMALRRSISFAVSEIDIAARNHSPLETTELEDLIAHRFLHAHQHSETDGLGAEILPPSVQQVKLLEEYLVANWNRALDVETMARISNVSARSIFRHFKKVRGCSPHTFLKNVRLQQARNALLNPPDDATIISVALKCGFQSLGHFARDYKSSFGELPSMTLSRSLQSTQAVS